MAICEISLAYSKKGWHRKTLGRLVEVTKTRGRGVQSFYLGQVTVGTVARQLGLFRRCNFASDRGGRLWGSAGAKDGDSLAAAETHGHSRVRNLEFGT